MATLYWIGGAAGVTQVDTVQITADDVGTTYTITIGNVTVSVLGTGTGVNDTASALKAALEASTHPYFTAMTYNDSTDTITITATTAGVPFIATSSATGGTGTIGAVTSSTAVAGPNDWSTAANWSTGSVPVSSDDVIIADNSVPIRWGLDQSAVDLASLTIRQSYFGEIGLRFDRFATSSDGFTANATVNDYREPHLTLDGPDRVDIGQKQGPGTAQGSRLINIDTGSNASTIKVHNTAPSGIDSLNAVNILCNHASTNLFVTDAPGGVGVAALVPGETATLSKIAIDGRNPATRTQAATGTTLTTWEQNGGSNILDGTTATVATVTVNDGLLRTEGDFTITTGNHFGGTWISNHIKTGGDAITTLNIDGSNAIHDASRSDESRTYGTTNFRRGQFHYDPDTLTTTALNIGDSRPHNLSLMTLSG